jgi:hypothetical protein
MSHSWLRGFRSQLTYVRWLESNRSMINHGLPTIMIMHKWGFIVLNTVFNNISVISWLSVLLVEETGVPGENHRPAVNRWQTLSQNVVSTPTAPIKITILLRTWNTTKWNIIFRHNFCCLWTLYLVITCTFIFK